MNDTEKFQSKVSSINNIIWKENKMKKLTIIYSTAVDGWVHEK